MPNRKSPRAQRFDYTASAGYFVTICTKDRLHYFGEIVDGKMELNEIGKLLVGESNIQTVGTDYICPNENGQSKDACNASLQPRSCVSESLGSIIRGFKIGITKYATANDIPFARQGRYHDHIIRNDGEYERIKYYIQTNPENWNKDCFINE